MYYMYTIIYVLPLLFRIAWKNCVLDASRKPQVADTIAAEGVNTKYTMNMKE